MEITKTYTQRQSVQICKVDLMFMCMPTFAPPYISGQNGITKANERVCRKQAKQLGKIIKIVGKTCLRD